jgi:hypothetical protein
VDPETGAVVVTRADLVMVVATGECAADVDAAYFNDGDDNDDASLSFTMKQPSSSSSSSVGTLCARHMDGTVIEVTFAMSTPTPTSPSAPLTTVRVECPGFAPVTVMTASQLALSGAANSG